MGTNKFSTMAIDAIGEIMNISLGASATAASTMLDAKVDITTPQVRIQHRDEFSYTNLEPAVCVEITYVEGLTGNNVMLLKRHDVKAIVEMLMGMEIPEEEFELNEMNMSAICEVMNQMMGASATALSELLGRTVNISTPRAYEVTDDGMFKEKYFPQELNSMVIISFRLDIAEKLDSEFMNLMPVELAKELVQGFFPDMEMEDDIGDTPSESQSMGAQEPAVSEPATPAPASTGSSEKMSQEAMDALLASMSSQETAQPTTPTPAPASTGSSEKMSQEAMDALLASMSGQETAQPAAPAPTSTGSSEKMSQEAMDALFASMGSQETAAPASQPVQPAVQQQMQQPVMQPVMMPDMTGFSQSLLEMQKMQMKMLEQMQQMQQREKEQQEARQERQPKQLKVHAGIQRSVHDTAGEVDPDSNLDLIMGVPVEVSVEIGRTKKLVKDILELKKGSLVVLDKLAGEQVDLFVNGQCIAKGDVVVVDDNFGIRITQILAENMPAVE